MGNLKIVLLTILIIRNSEIWAQNGQHHMTQQPRSRSKEKQEGKGSIYEG